MAAELARHRGYPQLVIRGHGSARSWNVSWTGYGVRPVRRVQCVRHAALFVQLERLVQGRVFLVMNRSSVRFRQAAPRL